MAATMTLRAPDADLTLSMRAPLSSSIAPAMSTTLPELNLNFEALRARMTDFTARFDQFITTSRSAVLESRAAYRLALSQHAEESSNIARQIESQEAKNGEHNKGLAAQQSEAAEMKSKITELEGVRDERRKAVDSLREKLDGMRSKLAGKKAGLRQREMYAGFMRGQNSEELESWELGLGMRIEGTGDQERVRFVFEVPGNRTGKTVSFELDMSGLAPSEKEKNGLASGRGYEVVECAPRVDAARVEKIVERMCDGEQLGSFLGEMRSLLLESAQ